MKERRIGFTVLECLVVVAIIGLTATLLLSVVQSSRRSGKRTACTSQLRQIGLAVSIYLEEFMSLPANFDQLALSQASRIDKILLCPSDLHSGFGTKAAVCEQRPIQTQTSYESVFGMNGLITKLEEHDENHGIVICRLDANPSEWFKEASARFCQGYWAMYDGPFLRLRKDGSVQRAKLVIDRVQYGDEFAPRLPVWRLYSDEPDPFKLSPAGN